MIKSTPKISIAMTYYDRLSLLKETLHSISLHTWPDEIIIVDDGSLREPLDEVIIKDISCDMNVIMHRIQPELKTWINSCIPFNKAFSLCTGDVIIIQNAECWHRDDIVDYCKNTILMNDNNYLVFGCYSLPKNANLSRDRILNDRSVTFDGDDAWYQHSIYRPVCYHFTTAISRNTLMKLRGFDENYADGTAYEDNEFLYRVKRITNVIQVDSHIVFHQNHYNAHSKNTEYNAKTNLSKFQALSQYDNYTGFKSSL